MILNYHTLRRWVDEMAPELIGAKVIESFSQRRDALHIGIITVSRQHGTLEICAEKGSSHLVFRRDFRRKNKNSADLFQPIIGEKIADLALDQADRIVRIRLSSAVMLEIELYSPVNIYLMNHSGQILDAFKDSKIHIGTKRSPVMRDSDDLTDRKVFKKRIHSIEEFKSDLSGGLAHFNKHLAMECLAKAVTLDECYNSMRDILSRLQNGKPRIYRHLDEPMLFSLIDLEFFRTKHSNLTVETFESVNEAILEYLSEKSFYSQKKEKLQDIARAIRMRIRKHEMLIEELKDDHKKAGSFELFEQKAHLLNLHMAELTRGTDRISVENIYDEKGRVITIELNPEWPPKRNVEEYFARAKKMRQSVDKIAGRIRTLETETQRLNRLQAELDNRERRDWKKIDKTYDEFLRAGWIKPKKEVSRIKPEKEAPSFREFVIPGNWRVFVGQNDTKNDQLTFKFAKSDDYWFHARGVPGSHVLLKRDGRKDNPGKQAIEAAASIAAWFSKGKTSSLVPVSYTLKKYVRKPKGSRSGQVVIEREEVVIVPPKEMH